MRELRLEIGIRICDVVGGLLDRVMVRLFSGRWMGACVLFHDCSAPRSYLR